MAKTLLQIPAWIVERAKDLRKKTTAAIVVEFLPVRLVTSAQFTRTFFRVVADCYSAPPRHPGQVQSFHHNDYVPGSEEEGADGFETMRQPSSDYLLSVH